MFGLFLFGHGFGRWWGFDRWRFLAYLGVDNIDRVLERGRFCLVLAAFDIGVREFDAQERRVQLALDQVTNGLM